MTWIAQINAGSRQYGLTYGAFMNGMVQSNIQINRKILSELAQTEPYSFKAIVDYTRVFLENKPHYPVAKTVDIFNPVKDRLKFDPRRLVHGITKDTKSLDALD